MIKNDYYKDIINISEANSGFQDHKDFNRVLSDLLHLIEKNIASKTTIKYLLKFIKYKKLPIEPDFVVEKSLFIKFIDAIPSERMKSFVILGAAAYFDNGKLEIVFDINKYSTTNDLLNSLDKFEEYLSHELVHIFKHLYGQYQKTMADYNKKKNDSNQLIDTWYWTNKHEIQSYITQINTQLKNIKKEIPEIKFKEAILKTDGYRLLNQFLPMDKKYILHEVLRKSVNYWINNLGGKLNEYRIRLK